MVEGRSGDALPAWGDAAHREGWKTMGSYRIKQQATGLEIEVDVAEDQQPRLLEAFRECQEGRCSCPTDEYQKLESLEIRPDQAGIKLHLRPKPGTRFDPAEIDRCLRHTVTKAASAE